MKDVRIDEEGELRCWNCGSKGFKSKRTLRSKALVGVGTLVTKKKLKCESCGEYNDTGNAKPWEGPKSARLAKKFGTGDVPGAAPPSMNDELSRLAGLHRDGALTDEEFAAAKAKLLG